MNKLTHPGNLIIAGLLGMMLFMIYMVTQCLNQNISMVNDNYYQKEVEYQQEIDATQNANEYAKEYSISKRGSTVEVSVPKSLSAAMTKGQINFYCPSDKTQDRVVPMEPSETGVYPVNTTGWKTLGYTAKIEFESKGKKYYHELFVSI